MFGPLDRGKLNEMREAQNKSSMMANRRESGYGSFGDPMGGEMPASKGGTLIKDRSKKEHTLNKDRAQLDAELTFDQAKPDTATIL